MPHAQSLGIWVPPGSGQIRISTAYGCWGIMVDDRDSSKWNWDGRHGSEGYLCWGWGWQVIRRWYFKAWSFPKNPVAHQAVQPTNYRTSSRYQLQEVAILWERKDDAQRCDYRRGLLKETWKYLETIIRWEAWHKQWLMKMHLCLPRHDRAQSSPRLAYAEGNLALVS